MKIVVGVLLSWAVALTAVAGTDVQRSPHVSIAYPESSRPLASLPPATAVPAQSEHPILANPFLRPQTLQPDPVAQTLLPAPNMPATILNFPGQGRSTSPTTITGTPPDTVGAAGPNHYVQTVNGGIEIWNKSGTVVMASRSTNSLWSGYTGTNAGNACATQNDGDAIVLYDRLADRWFITQFSLPNLATTGSPSFQCVAVSKTGDPTGAYWLYDFQYNGINDYGKFGVWPDAYYASFNMFTPAGGGSFNYAGAEACAYDRQAMLAGSPATQQCFQQPNTVFGLLPATFDGSVPPPRGEPGFFVELGEDASFNFDNTLHLSAFHVDWTTPANSTFTGPAVLPVAAFTWPCQATGTCIPELGGSALDALGDRLMFRLAYRNFGTHESLVVNHTVIPGSTTGIRWYEIRSPNATPAIFQQGTYVVADSNWRWMGSIAQDQAQDLALGFSLSSSTTHPAMAWTGRLPSDTAGLMGQGETVFATGLASNTINRWGDYSAMTVDPTDDCTFWFTTEYYLTAGSSTWDTRIASTKFPNCAQNNFSLSVTPSSQSVAAGGQTTYSVSSALTAGTAETIALNIQDLPTGVTAGFNPSSITAGSSSTLTLTANAGAPVTASPVTFTVIGKATDAVHPATATVSVTTPAAPPAPTNVVATASSTSQVDISWNAVSGATGYRVFRASAPGVFALVASPVTNAFSDTAVAANTAYLYKVQAFDAGGNSPDSNVDLATTVIFTDDPLVSGTTFVQGLHLTELRTAISAVATLAGTGPLTFTDPTITGGTTFIKSVHVTELRSDLNTALGALSLPTLTFANSAAPDTVISAMDFTELRNGMK